MNENEILEADHVGPCGCPGCESWADCDYCSECSPLEFMSDEDAAEFREAEWYEFGIDGSRLGL